MTVAPRSAPRLSGYLHHNSTGQARVRINGEDHYLGGYRSEVSRRKYGKLIAQHASGLPLDPSQTTDEEDSGLSVVELSAWISPLHGSLAATQCGKSHS